MAGYVYVTGAEAVPDWAELHGFLHRCFAGMQGRIDPPSSLHRMSPETLREMAQNQHLMLCLAEGEIVGCGYGALDSGHVYLSKFAVAEAHRRRGILARLVNLSERFARDFDKPALELQSRVELVETHAAFLALGFAVTGEFAHPGYDRTTYLRFRKSL